MPDLHAFPKQLQFTAPVELTAAAEDGKDPTFEMVAYTGVPMNAGGFYSPVIVELSGVKTANPNIPILLDHDSSKIVGQGEVKVDSAAVRVSGSILGEDSDSAKVLTLAKKGFKWQASIGANVTRREFLEAGKKAVVNGREVSGPLMIARESMLQEVSFVAIGADQATSAAVAASHSQRKVMDMDPKFAAWLEAAGFVHHESLTEQQLKPLRAQWERETAVAPVPSTVADVIARQKSENARQARIAELTLQFFSENPLCGPEITAQVETMADLAVKANWTADKYDTELLRATRPQQHVFRPSAIRGQQINDRVLEAAVCMAGRLPGHEEMFDDQTLQAAHTAFRNGIGLKQLFLICAQQNGYHGNYGSDVTIECQRAAFGMQTPNRIQAAGGMSALNISNILANTANKFLMRGWNAIDMTPMRIAKIRPVRDFKQITTVSLTGDLQFDKLGVTGEIKHGTLADLTYTNQADTYARMLAITRKDIINDDLGALTEVPERLGRGGALKLNDIFWTEWLVLVSDSFFASGNSNINTGVADMTLGGLTATEVIFMNQTDPDGKPLGVMPKIIVVPTALKAAAVALMDPQGVMITGSDLKIPNVNPFKGRFTVESSPYISNSSYTGYTSVGWWMIADPNELPVIEIVALNGRVEPVVESADADFNTLGIQMRGYADVGVKRQEKRAGVYADGGAS